MKLLAYRRYLVLLQLPIRHLVRPHSDRLIRERHSIRPIRHLSAQCRPRLHESGGSTERTEAGLKILERLIAEIEVGARREE